MLGLNINQEDLPWWATAILGWLAMVKTIQETTMKGWPEGLKVKLEYEAPSAIYSYYRDFMAAQEREARSAAR